jgi:hypothetical protein
MNIKLKATLITLAMLLIAVALIYTIAKFPAVLVFAALGGMLYFLYRGVLSHLEYKEKRGKR